MEPFKNEFSYLKARCIAKEIKGIYSPFSVLRFSSGLKAALEPLELKQRMHLLADRIETCLPSHPPDLFDILTRTLASPEKKTDGLKGFLVWPLTEIVARRGLSHFSEAMLALSEMTQRFTAEFAIRRFLLHDLERTFKQLHDWCDHPNEHVRRLVSEGSRPFLPWGGNLTDLLQAPHPTLGLLEKLRHDPSKYVRLSVSNHLNDFSKHNPELVIQLLTRWRKSATNEAHWDKLSHHACRTLLKAGHSGAMKLLGYHSAKCLLLDIFHLTNLSVKLGNPLGFHLMVRNPTSRPLRIMFDYAIHHRKANGSLSPKVFKGRIKQLAAGECWEIIGMHSFKPVTTRVYHPGIHYFEPLLNGRPFPPLEFMLETS